MSFQIPDKSIASLVKYYYSWKKTRSRANTERQPNTRHKSKDNFENGSGESSVTGEYYIQNQVSRQFISFILCNFYVGLCSSI